MKLLLLSLSIFITSFLFSQESLNRKQAESSVGQYLISKDKHYSSISFGEFFIQTYPEWIGEKLNTDKKVKYSLVHTYKMGATKIVDMYFHLDEKYEVIGNLTSKEMDEMLLKHTQSKLDSIMNSLVPNSAPSR